MLHNNGNILHTTELYLKMPAAAAAKLLQSSPPLCDPRDGSPPGMANFMLILTQLKFFLNNGKAKLKNFFNGKSPNLHMMATVLSL